MAVLHHNSAFELKRTVLVISVNRPNASSIRWERGNCLGNRAALAGHRFGANSNVGGMEYAKESAMISR